MQTTPVTIYLLIGSHKILNYYRNSIRFPVSTQYAQCVAIGFQIIFVKHSCFEKHHITLQYYHTSRWWWNINNCFEIQFYIRNTRKYDTNKIFVMNNNRWIMIFRNKIISWPDIMLVFSCVPAGTEFFQFIIVLKSTTYKWPHSWLHYGHWNSFYIRV